MSASKASAKASKVGFQCSACGATPHKWTGRCGGCGEWDTIEEVAPSWVAGPGVGGGGAPAALVPITEVPAQGAAPWSTAITELDRVLGGGIVPGSVVLLGGEPGVGKSTLLLEVAAKAAAGGRKVVYLTGEESPSQVAARAARTGAAHPGVKLATVTELGQALAVIASECPDLLVVDSIQTLSSADLDSAPGGVTHVRAVTAALVGAAKRSAMACLLVGHVTKDGLVAGPRTLEHLVDAVAMFEGDRHSALRLLRCTKNRFGSADEVGCFEMAEDGIHEVVDPSGLFLAGGDSSTPGSCASVMMEGRRPVAVGVQALSVLAVGSSPRRTVTGLGSARTAMLLAVLEARCGLDLRLRDVYAATVGGVHCQDPATDLAVVLAAASAHFDLVVPPGLVAIGEVGLSGQIRPVKALARRLEEASRLGFAQAAIPAGAAPQLGPSACDLELIEVAEARDVLRCLQPAGVAAV
ncbi:MAG: DNA repair protein RadA [Bifidobacteriaceae bacterium]|jgi:DNA repair protein RadA/Sms|nr:DNA repair protein RadA [Bifidobacteriaceae bacterium]